MNLFRSEEHARDWAFFDPNSEEGIMPLADWISVFSTEGRRHLLDANYISLWRPGRVQEREQVLAHLGKSGPFWQRT